MSGAGLVRAGVLNVAYEEWGAEDGDPVVLLHGFPYDIRAYDEVARLLADAGLRVVVPHLRGYGPTRFVDPGVPRSGQQAALGSDLLELMDALAATARDRRGLRLGRQGGLRRGGPAARPRARPGLHRRL